MKKKFIGTILLILFILVSASVFGACLDSEVTLKFEDLTIVCEDAFSVSNEDFKIVYSINNSADYLKTFDYKITLSCKDASGKDVIISGDTLRIDDKRETYFVTITATSGDKSVERTFTVNGKFKAELLADGTYSIKGYNSDFLTAENINLVIPETHNNVKVTGVSKRAFFENEKIVSVTVPENIKTIGKEAFYGCTSLAAVNVEGSGIETVSEKAFMNCTILSSVNKTQGKNTLPDSLETLEAYAFRNTALTNFEIPEKIEEISDNCFAFCAFLTEYSQRGNITRIGAFAFEGAEKLNSVNLEGVSEVGAGAFKSCSSIEKIEITQSVTILEKSAFRYCKNLKNIFVTSEVKAATVEDFVFDSIHPAFKIFVPDSRYLRYFEDEGWSVYSDYVEPDEDEDEEEKADDEEEKRTNHIFKVSTLKGENNLFAVIDTEGGYELISFIGSETDLVIPSVIDGKNIVKIGDNAFNNTNLTSVVIPDTVKTIGEKAFFKCGNLVEIDFGNGVTEIGDEAFSFCNSLTDLTLPDSLITVGKSSFAHLENITSLHIGEGLKDVGEGAFVTAVALTGFSVNPANINLSVEDGVLYNYNKTELISYPAGKAGETFLISKSVTSIGYGAFYGYSFKDIYTEEYIEQKRFPKLREIEIPSSVTQIGEKAFYQCPYLEKVIISNNPTMIIEKNAFGECEALTWIELPAALLVDNSENEEWNYYGAEQITTVVVYGVDEYVTICDYAFYRAENLTSVTLNNVTTIGNGAFMLASKLKENAFSCDESLEFIGKKAFFGTEWEKESTSGIFINDVLVSFSVGENKNITIEGAVKKIAPNVFSGTDIVSVNITAATLSEIGTKAFENCLSLEEITLPSSLITIGEGAFLGCVKLRDVKGSITSLDTIEKEAFKNCEKLVNLPVLTARIIGDNAFDSNKSLTNVTFTDNLNILGKYAFRNCGLTSFKVPVSVSEIGIGVVQASSNIYEMEVVFLSSSGQTATYISYYFGSNEPTRPATPSALKKLTVLKCTGGAISDNAFNRVGTLETVILSASIKTIGKNAFYASGIKNLTLQSDTVVIGDSTSFTGVGSTLILKVPTALVDDYFANSYWNKYNIQAA